MNPTTPATTRAKFSIPSIIAVVAAIASFMVGAFGGFVLAIIAIIAALIGIFSAMSPSVRGGFVSMVSLFAGGLALIAALIKAIRWLF
jgi:hypothetical protein